MSLKARQPGTRGQGVPPREGARHQTEPASKLVGYRGTLGSRVAGKGAPPRGKRLPSKALSTLMRTLDADAETMRTLEPSIAKQLQEPSIVKQLQKPIVKQLQEPARSHAGKSIVKQLKEPTHYRARSHAGKAHTPTAKGSTSGSAVKVSPQP